MEAKDLRIGNWVCGMMTGNFQVEKTDFATFEAINCWGIPLSPEILIACGFNNSMGSKFWDYDRWFALEVEDNHFLYDLFRNKQVEIYYLHQLQNLYFALTNTELTIKL